MALKPLSGLFTNPTAPPAGESTPTTPTPQSSTYTCHLPRMYSRPLETPQWGDPIETDHYRDALPWLA